MTTSHPSGQSLRAAVLVMSDSIAAGKNEDQSGVEIKRRLTTLHMDVVDYKIIPDDFETIRRELVRYADELKVNLVVTTGGTGLSLRDVTPEATGEVIERDVPGIAETIRAFGRQRTPFAMLSRGRAGVRGNTLIVNLPGSKKGVEESLDAILPGLLHAFKMMRGEGH